MTKPLAEQFEEELREEWRKEVKRWTEMDALGSADWWIEKYRTAETEIRADAEKQANDHLKAIIGMERDMAKAEERARVVEWVGKKQVEKHDNVIPEPTDAELEQCDGNDDYVWCGRDISAYEAKMYNLALSDLLSFLTKENK